MNVYVIGASFLMLFGLVIPRTELIAPQHVVSVSSTVNEQGEERQAVLLRPIAIEPLAPTRIDLHSLGVALTARAALVRDSHSKAILWEKNPDDVRSIASITKLVTALVAIPRIADMDATVAITAEDYSNEGFNSLPAGTPFKVRDLMAAMLIESNNSATHAVVRSTGMSRQEFVIAMNEYVKALGLSKTSFVDPTGLSAGNVSTAAEVMVFADAALNHETIARLTGTKTATIQSATGGSYTIRSTNQLLGSATGVRAGKTGFVTESGYNLVAETVRDNHVIAAVVLGSATSEDRFQDYRMLVNWTWEHFVWPS